MDVGYVVLDFIGGFLEGWGPSYSSPSQFLGAGNHPRMPRRGMFLPRRGLILPPVQEPRRGFLGRASNLGPGLWPRNSAVPRQRNCGMRRTW
jgi:hypothetical protein